MLSKGVMVFRSDLGTKEGEPKMGNWHVKDVLDHRRRVGIGNISESTFPSVLEKKRG